METDKKINYLLIIYIFISIHLLTGCTPKQYTVIPEVKGKVINKITKKPIYGVQIGHIKSDHNGKFLLKGKQKIGIGTPMGGIWKLDTMMFTISDERYHPMACSCECFSHQKGCTDVTIEMIPMELKEITSPEETGNFSCRVMK